MGGDICFRYVIFTEVQPILLKGGTELKLNRTNEYSNDVNDNHFICE